MPPPAAMPPAFWRLLGLTVLHFGALAGLLLAGRWIRLLGGSESVLGWFSASIVPGIVLGALTAGRLAGPLGEKPLMLAGMALTAGMTACFAAFDQISVLFIPLRFGQGFGHGIVFTCLISLAAQLVPDHKKAQGMGYVALCAQLGNLSGVALAENLLLPSGFAQVFLGCAALTLVAWCGAWSMPWRHGHAAGSALPGGGLTPQPWHVAIAVAFFLVLGGTYGTVLQLIPLLVQDLGRATGEALRATPVMAAIFVTVALCRLLLARLADSRFRRPLLIASTLLLLVATLLWPHAASLGQMTGVAVIFALGYGLLFPGLNGLVLSRVAASWRARASGWIVMAFDGGFFGLLLALGPLAEACGMAVMFAALAALLLATAALFLALVRHLGRSAA